MGIEGIIMSRQCINCRLWQAIEGGWAEFDGGMSKGRDVRRIVDMVKLNSLPKILSQYGLLKHEIKHNVELLQTIQWRLKSNAFNTRSTYFSFSLQLSKKQANFW